MRESLMPPEMVEHFVRISRKWWFKVVLGRSSCNDRRRHRSMSTDKDAVKQQERQLAFLEDDSLPLLEPLCDIQASIAEAYAEVLAHLAQKLSTATQSTAVGLGILLERLQYDAPLAVSEVRKSGAFKLRRQRYISKDVFDRWRDLQAQSRPLLADFAKVANSTVTHEYVVQRRGLGNNLRAMTDVQHLADELSRVKACVVSKAEDARLRKVKDVDGWRRYHQANPPVRVYDRKTKRWLSSADV